jgi:hypothetical protein
MSTDRKVCGCPFCGAPVTGGQSVCTPCSVTISRCCSCGKPLPQKAATCPECGKEQPGRQKR